MTTIVHQCYRCGCGTSYEEIEDKTDERIYRRDGDCGCSSKVQDTNYDDYNDD